MEKQQYGYCPLHPDGNHAPGVECRDWLTEEEMTFFYGPEGELEPWD